jgi:hypothetical protein
LLKAKQVQFTAKLIAAQLAARQLLEASQLAARAALSAEGVLATAIATAALLKEELQQPPPAEQNL